MFPEKEIVGLWLNSQGYLVVDDINAGKNKVIDALALKVEHGQLVEAVHVEVSVSVSGQSVDLSELRAKFNDELIKRAIESFIRKFSRKMGYKKMLVVNAPSVENPGDIDVVSFEKVLGDVLVKLDKQNYANPTVRTLQLLQYLIITNPAAIVNVLSKSVSRQNCERIIENILKLPAAKGVFNKKKNRSSLAGLFTGSILTKPEPLARFVLESFTTRSFNQFLKELFKHEKAKRFTIKTSPRQRSLKVFLD